MGITYIADLIAREPETGKRQELEHQRVKVVRIIYWGLIDAAFTTTLALVASLYAGAFVPYFIIYSLGSTAVLPLYWHLVHLMGISGICGEFDWGPISFAMGVVAIGADRGQLDRHLPFTSFQGDRVKCREHMVFTPIGGRFLTVTRDNLRHVVDDKCDIEFTVPVADWPDGSLVGDVIARWRSDQ